MNEDQQQIHGIFTMALQKQAETNPGDWNAFATIINKGNEVKALYAHKQQSAPAPADGPDKE